jgi:signal transduction histidine kinase/ActR/RegA family two-component response regulator
MKIRLYLALMASAILVPVVFFSGIALNALLDTQRNVVLAQAQEDVRESMARIDRELLNAQVITRALAGSPYLEAGNWAKFYQQAKTLNADGPFWTVLTDENSQQLINTLVPFGTKLPLTLSREQVDQVFQLDKPQVSNLITGPLAQQHVVAVFYPVKLANGKRYIVAQIVRATYFNAMLSMPVVSRNFVQGVFDRNCITIARNRDPEKAIGKPPSNKALHQAMQDNEQGMISNVTREGKSVYTIFLRSNFSGWTGALGVPVEEVELVARDAIRVSVIVLCMVLVYAIGAAIFFGGRLNRSITRAAYSAVGLGKGVMPTRINSGIHEVETLHQAIYNAGRLLKDTEEARTVALAKEKVARRKAEAQNTAKDEFLAMLGHELRNPLAPITAAADLIKRSQGEGLNLKRMADIIVRQVRHLTELVDDLLDVSRVTRGLIELEQERMDMKQVIHDAVEQVRPFMQSQRHHLIVQVPDAPVFAYGDQKRLIQVLTNLLNNAAKYTPEGGNIICHMRIDAPNIVLSVADNGMGMTPELLERAFELFAQAERTSDRSQGGLGLGLALVKSLVELHGGDVTASSAGLGEGSTFTITLPILVEADPFGDQPDATSDNAVPNARKIMVVDDNKDAADTLAALLQTLGYQVLVEYDSRRALERARIEVPDVYLLDIGLPVIDGNEVARRLRANPATAGALLIAITGYGQIHDREGSLAAGFDHHFVKPIDIERLSELLRELQSNDNEST